jgi:TonB family protein
MRAESVHVPLHRVQTGGFGDPQGLPGEAQGGNPGNVPKLGAFDLPDGPGRGNGTGGAQGSARVVASAGFGDGSVTVGQGLGAGVPGAVKTGAFGAAPESAHAPANPPRVEPPRAQTQPVEILSKPAPQYTEEARRLRVQGEVVLSVVFQADGTLKVLGVVKSLGYGLDEMAARAASEIRFKPAKRDGQPTDFPALLRIEFRLA